MHPLSYCIVCYFSLCCCLGYTSSWILTVTYPKGGRRSPEPFPRTMQTFHHSRSAHGTVSSLQAFADEPDYFGNVPVDDGDNDDDEGDDLTDEELEAMMGEWDERIARYNTVTLTGRIGNDPEPRYFDDGKVVVNISLASRQKYHGLERKVMNLRSGEEETQWFGLEIWGQTAEFVSKYVKKGARVGVVGQLQIDTWIDNDSGEPRSRPKVIVRDLDILETRAEADLRKQGSRGSSFFSDADDDYGGSKASSGGFFDM